MTGTGGDKHVGPCMLQISVSGPRILCSNSHIGVKLSYVVRLVNCIKHRIHESLLNVIVGMGLEFHLLG